MTLPLDGTAPERDPDAAGGVGLTALMVAAARAIETHRPAPLARDEFAEHFVRAAPASADWPVRADQIPGGRTNPFWERLGRYFAVRTRVLDDHLLRTVETGVRQVVLLGAGLDSRAFRLGWPPGCVIHEVDTAEMLAFKQAVLDRSGAVPTADRRPLAADLRFDWRDALLAAGFDPAVPTAWLAEGLLLYLPAAAERHLIATVAELSTAGSTLAYEIKEVEGAKVRAHPLYTTAREQIGLDLPALFDPEPRPASAAELARRGWSVSVRSPYDFTRLHDHGPFPEPDDPLAANRWIFAETPAPQPGNG